MKTASILVLVISIACSAGLLVLSLWPGAFDTLYFIALLTAVFWVPMAGIGALVLLVLALSLIHI